MVFYLREGMLKCKNKKLTRNKDKAKLKTRKTRKNKSEFILYLFKFHLKNILRIKTISIIKIF